MSRFLIGSLIVSLLLFIYFFGTKSKKDEFVQSNVVAVSKVHKISEIQYIDSSNGITRNMVASIPDGRMINVSIKFDQNVAEPYIEVPILNYEDGKGDFVAWGLGGVLYLKDYKQLEQLWLNKP